MALDGEQVAEAETTRGVGTFKYYFLIVAGLVIFVAIVLWYLHRRTTRKREFWAYDGEQALARDAQGAYNTRTFMYGLYGASNSFLGRRSQGTDGTSEPPPPYNSKSGAPMIDVTIPLPTLSMSPNERSQLPQYPNGTEEFTSPARRQQAGRV